MNADDEQKRANWRKPEHWRFVGAVIDGVAIDVCGENPWRHSWQSMACEVELPDPIYPGQSHRLNVYSINGKRGVIVFAAGEFSNGVWGFYEQADGAAPTGRFARLLNWFSRLMHRRGKKPSE